MGDLPSPVVIVQLGEDDWSRNRDLRLELLATDGWAFGARLEHEREIT